MVWRQVDRIARDDKRAAALRDIDMFGAGIDKIHDQVRGSFAKADHQDTLAGIVFGIVGPIVFDMDLRSGKPILPGNLGRIGFLVEAGADGDGIKVFVRKVAARIVADRQAPAIAL